MKPTEKVDESTLSLFYNEGAQSKFDQDAIHDFNLHGEGNRIALLGSSSEIITLELTPNISYLAKFPYNCANMKLMENRPLNKLMKDIKFKSIYANGDLLERQDLALEPAYIELCSIQPPEPKLMHIAWSPQTLDNGQELLAALTSYGALNLLTKQRHMSTWQQLPIDVPSLVQQSIVPQFHLKPASITKFCDFKAYVDRYWITAFVWRQHASPDEHILIAGTAFGFLLLMKFNAAADTLVSYSCLNTNMERITYLTTQDDLLLVCNAQGMATLFKINDQCFELLKCLWSKADRMGISQALITHDSENDSYFLLFTKAAHMLAYNVSREGILHSSTRLYLGGLKLSGLVAMTSNTFILTTINCVVHHITIATSADKSEMRLTKGVVCTDIDAVNFQILGATLSESKNLLTLMLFRNHEYDTHQSIYSRRTSLVSVGKLNSVNALTFLNSKPVDDMLHHTDLLIALRLDVINDCDTTQYVNFFELANAKFPMLLDEQIQRSMQIKYLFTTTLAKALSDKRSKSSLAELSKYHLAFLQSALGIIHILQRLEYLASVDVKTSNQKRAIDYMKLKYKKLADNMKQLKEQSKSLEESTESFLEMATASIIVLADDMPKISSSSSSDKSQANESEHNAVHECVVSFMPLELCLNNRYCVLCGRNAQLDESLLRELYAPDERIRCPYCRSSFRVEEACE